MVVIVVADHWVFFVWFELLVVFEVLEFIGVEVDAVVDYWLWHECLCDVQQ